MRAIRGNDIAMIFQEPMTSLNPVFTVGDQIIEAIMLHQQLSRGAARKAARCWKKCACPTPRHCWTAIRTSCPAACASA